VPLLFQSLPNPTYEEIGLNFVVTFKKAETKYRGGLNGGESAEKVFGSINENIFIKTTQKAVQKTTQKQDDILAYLSKCHKAGREEIAKTIEGISVSGVKYNLKILQDRGLLKRVGSPKGGHWEVLI